MKRILLAFFITAGFLTGCKSNEGGDPKMVLTKFFEALSKNDIADARKYATDESKSMLDMIETGMKMNEDAKKENEKFDAANMQYGEAKIDGDKAVVPVKELRSGESMNYTLKKEKGEWKVAFDKTTLMTMGKEKMDEKGMNLTDSISKGLEELKNTDMDSLKAELGDAMKTLDSLKH